MDPYSIVPEFQYYKSFPILGVVCQLVAIIFVFFGYTVSSIGFILAFLYETCSIYYVGLTFINKFYRLDVSSNLITVRGVFNKDKKYNSNSVRWVIRRLPWYNSYFIFLYDSGKIPIAVIKPHWTNALKLTKYQHLGPLSPTEISYLRFLKKVSML